jgi:tetratricopeptide (TPR) repeat protein
VSDDGKGGLFGDDDLLSELDAWDKTFDALHDAGAAEIAEIVPKEPEPAPAVEAAPGPSVAASPPPPPPSDRPAVARSALPPRPPTGRVPPIAVVPPVPAPAAGRSKPRTTPPTPPPKSSRPSTDSPFEGAEAARDFDETDFSDLGVDGEPEALGSLLGVPPPLPPVDELGAAPRPPEVVPIAPRRPGPPAPPAPPARPAAADKPPDDDVFTSAPRPATPFGLDLGPTDDELFGDLPDKPPIPAGGLPAPAAPAGPGSEVTRVADLSELGAAFDEVSGFSGETQTGERGQRAAPAEPRGPAIVRRDDLERRRRGEADGDFGSGEPTRVADVAQIEALAQRQREESEAASAAAAAFFAEEPAPEVDLAVDEDFYDDIEIGTVADESSEGVPAEPMPTPSTQSRRATAHVVRRAAPAPVDEGPVLEMEADEGGMAVTTGSSARAMSVDDALAELDELAPAAPEEAEAVPARAAAEVDFSDVAAAVAQEDEGEPVELAAEWDGDEGAAAVPAVPTARPGAPTLLGLEPVPSRPPTVPGADRASTMSEAAGAVPGPAAAPPIPTPAGETLEAAGVAPGPAAPAPDVAPELPPSRFGEPDLGLDLDAVSLPERVDPTAGIDLGEAAAASLLVYERELESIDDTAATAAIRVEAGRLSERLGDLDRARTHYEAALLADPRASQALRGLRRIARAAGDLEEATRHLDAELEMAGPLERRALALHRVDLLMAVGDQDLARVATGELLDGAPSDVRALLAQLELAFLDGRAEEFGESLDRLAQALADPALRAAVEVARGHLDERVGGDPDRAAAAFTAAAETDPRSVGARLGQARIAAGRGDVAGYVTARTELAQRLAESDPATGAAIALRAAQRAVAAGPAPAADVLVELEGRAVAAAAALAPQDELVLEAARTAAVRRGDTAAAAGACRELAGVASSPAVRAAAAAQAAAYLGTAGDPVSATVLYQIAAELDPRNDAVAAALDRLLAAQGDASGAALALATRLAVDAGHQRDRIRLAEMVAAAPSPAEGEAPTGTLDEALRILAEGWKTAPGASALVDAGAAMLAAAGRWHERAELLGQVAAVDSPEVDPELGHLRAAVAYDAWAGAAADADEAPRALAAALDAWTKVLDFDAEAGRAHGAAIALARRLGDRDVLADVLQRAQTSTRLGAAVATLALTRARGFALGDDPDLARADDVLREEGLPADDPRLTTAAEIVAARAGRWGDAALALEERADLAPAVEAASLRFRAAQLHLDKGDDAARAAQLLGDVASAHRGFAAAADLLGAARRRLGDAAAAAAPPPPRPDTAAGGNDAFARMVREADLAAAHGDAPAAVGLYSKALELRPGDPLAAEPLTRVAAAAGEPGPVAALALADLKRAEEAGDATALADAYEALAKVDDELRHDPGSALISWEAAATADPGRFFVVRQLERAYTAEQRWGDLARLREQEIAALDAAAARTPETTADPADAVALGLDRAGLAERDGRPDDELRAIYEDVIARDPRSRLALFFLEALVRRGGSSPALARLELAIADLYPDDARSRAAFLTRAGETLTELGQIELAIEKLRAADEVRPGYVPALQSWRWAALKGELWIDFAEAAVREADSISDGDVRARLYHLAGVAFMDKALAGERAARALRKALAADPRHRDAFIRLRMLLEEQGDYEDLGQLLDARVDVEDDPGARTELHRASAELHRNFLGDRDSAKHHYRAILEQDGADLRAIAALSDICWEQGAWAECAEALMTRARLEREPGVLRGIYRRLGTIYADRLPDPQHAIKAFQRVLSYDPEDREALERLADLGIATGEWRMALGACERLVRSEADPLRKAAHLHRVGTIFQVGFDDRKRAERAFIMALDTAPESDAALSELVHFYQEAGDVISVRVHLNRVAGAMRARIQQDPGDGVAYRVISRALAAREGANVRGSLAIARCAAEMARITGGAEAPEDALVLAAPPAIDVRALVRTEADDLLFPRVVAPELRQIFALLGDRVAKHVGVDLRPYGVTRGDRLRASSSAVAATAQDIAARLGLDEVDVYLSQRQPFAMVAEPTSPVSLVIGQAIATDPASVRFAAGAALKLAQSHLAIPARLPDDELGVLLIALLRLFQPDLPYLAVDGDAVAAQGHKLRRLIPSSLMNELRPFALGMNLVGFDHRSVARGITAAGWRAGVLTAAGIAAPLRVLAAAAQAPDVAAILADPMVADLVRFAVGEEYGTIAALG